MTEFDPETYRTNAPLVESVKVQATLEGRDFNIVMDEVIEVERKQFKPSSAPTQKPDPNAALGPGVQEFRSKIK